MMPATRMGIILAVGADACGDKESDPLKNP